MRTFCLIIGLVLSIVSGIRAQIHYTYAFSERLKECHLDFYQPVETWFKVRPKIKDRYMKYHLVVQNQENNLEMRYSLHPYKKSRKESFPHIENTRLVSHIATNNEEAIIRTSVFDDVILKERFNADWGSVNYFRPKLSYSEKPRGALITLFSEGKATVYIIILYEDEDFEPMDFFHFLRFRT